MGFVLLVFQFLLILWWPAVTDISISGTGMNDPVEGFLVEDGWRYVAYRTRARNCIDNLNPCTDHTELPYRKTLVNSRNVCFMNSTIQLLSASQILQEVVKVPDASRNSHWEIVIRSLNQRSHLSSHLVPPKIQQVWSETIEQIESSIPGHRKGTQNCVSFVLDIFLKQVPWANQYLKHGCCLCQ